MENIREELMRAKRGIGTFVVLINILIFVLILLFATSMWSGLKDVREAKLKISVSGEGSVFVAPDIAQLTATVLTEAVDLSQAQEANVSRANAVVSFLKANGVDEGDIKTTGYNIQPRYYYPPPCYGPECYFEREEPRITGYEVRNSIQIKIRDVGKAGTILSGIVDAGANQVSQLQFTVDDTNEARAQAREEAIKDATTKAKALAKSLGKRVDDIVSFSEGSSYPKVYRNYAFDEAAIAGAPAAAPNLQPGENEIVSNVNITFEFK